MKTKFFATILAILFLITSCGRNTTSNAAATPSMVIPISTATATLPPTSTPDPVIQAQQAALLYSQDFESGNADGLYDWGQGEWNIVTEANGNHIYCNKVSSDYPEFHFGAGTWSDYAVELQVKPTKINVDSTADLHIRFDPQTYLSFDGVIKLQDNSIYLAYNNPYQEFGDRGFAVLNTWYTLRMEVYGNHIRYYIDNWLMLSSDEATQRAAGKVGFGVAPNTGVCIDNIRVWALRTDGQIAQLPPRSNNPPPSLAERLASHKFPKLFYENQDNDPSTDALTQSSYYDLLNYGPEVALSEWAFMGPSGIIRTTNPNAVILTTMSVQEFFPWDNSVTGRDFVSKFQPDWEMKDIHGNPYAAWNYGNGQWSIFINLSTSVNKFIPDYLSNTTMRTGMFDGIFYDGTSEDWTWSTRPRSDNPPSSQVDANNDGQADTATDVNSAMDQGLQTLLAETRRVFPAASLITGNAGNGSALLLDKNAKSDTILANLLNGRMIEGFLYNWCGNGVDWLSNMRTYYLMQQASLEPKTSILMAYCTGTDYDHLRYVLASALMFDGYFDCTNSQTFGPNGPSAAYTATFWFDEYSVDLSSGKAVKSLAAKGYLGQPISDAYNVDDKTELLGTLLVNNDPRAEQLVWRRDFQNGIVLVNPSYNSKTIDLNGTFRKILGSIDPKFNDGSVVTKITLRPQSGIILLTMP